MYHAICLALALFLCACASPEPIRVKDRQGHIIGGSSARLSVGMSKQDVVALFGLPATVSATQDGEVYEYIEELPWWNWKSIAVTIANERVVSFGAPAIGISRGQTPNTLNNVRVGMDRDAVERVMGRPSSVSAKDGIEYMDYVLGNEHYFVRLVGGKVDAYGRKGDFDSTKVPTQRIEVINK